MRQLTLICATMALLSSITQAAPPDNLASMLTHPTKVFSVDTNTFPKWSDMLARHKRERWIHAWWEILLDGLKGDSKMAQLVAVNRFMNYQIYVPDADGGDTWASPGEFLRRGGDCEDYAIAKFISLRRLGWPSEALRMVVVWDTDRDLAHAILVVSLGHHTYVLDNTVAEILDARRRVHYRPILSLNEEKGWLYEWR